ncbi:MAG: hypothetical protein MEQ07_01555 [Aquimonas sp.]|nr:hypothetical protein [Aquimonas sp.]
MLTPLLLGLLALPFGASGSASGLQSYSGQAVDLRRAQPLYDEQHFVRTLDGQPTERMVVYRCNDGSAFARKQVDYGSDPFAPSFELVDARLDYREGLRRSGTGLVTFAGSGAGAREAAIEGASSLVADSGFDRFVQAHWQRLQAGDTVEIDFLVPSRGEALSFRLRKQESLQLEGVAASRIRLSLSGFLSLFAPNIDVIYRDSDQWLLRFEGLTNIRESVGRNLVARIDFPRTPETAPEEAWAAAAAEPLVDCQLRG